MKRIRREDVFAMFGQLELLPPDSPVDREGSMDRIVSATP